MLSSDQLCCPPGILTVFGGFPMAKVVRSEIDQFPHSSVEVM